MNALPPCFVDPSSAESRSNARTSPLWMALPLPFELGLLPSPIGSCLPFRSNEPVRIIGYEKARMHGQNDVLGGAWWVAAAVENMNCSVRSLLSFIFYDHI